VALQRRLVALRDPAVDAAGPVVGFFYGAAVAASFPRHTTPLWQVWMPLAIGATTAGGALLTYGRHRWHDLNKLSAQQAPSADQEATQANQEATQANQQATQAAVRVRDVFWPVFGVAVVSLVLMTIGPFYAAPSHLSALGLVGGRLGSGLVGMFAIVAAIPAAGAMFGVRRVAKGCDPGTQGELVDVLLTLRGMLQRLLTATGSVVALVTFSAGTWWLLERSLGVQYGSKPPQYVLVFGAFGSAVLGVVYGPAWTALQRRGRELCDEMFPLRGLDAQEKILSQVTDRQKLEQALGLDRGIVADLQGGVVILAPLLASAVAAFLPH
jgi:hypothetical protein